MNHHLSAEQKQKFEKAEAEMFHPNLGPFKLGESQGHNQMLSNSQKAQEAVDNLQNEEITIEFLKSVGFKQLEGGPENTLTNYFLTVTPEYKDGVMGNAYWRLYHGPVNIPMELKPKTKSQLVTLLDYIKNLRQALDLLAP